MVQGIHGIIFYKTYITNASSDLSVIDFLKKYDRWFLKSFGVGFQKMYRIRSYNGSNFDMISPTYRSVLHEISAGIIVITTYLNIAPQKLSNMYAEGTRIFKFYVFV